MFVDTPIGIMGAPADVDIEMRAIMGAAEETIRRARPASPVPHMPARLFSKLPDSRYLQFHTAAARWAFSSMLPPCSIYGPAGR